MATDLVKILADFSTQLFNGVAIGDTTATLVSVTDDDNVALPNGSYGFTIDGDNSAKEYIVCTITGTAVTAVVSISRQGAKTTGFVRAHRRGAKVAVTDWITLGKQLDLLNGTTDFDATVPLGYDAAPTFTDPNQFATVGYINSGAADYYIDTGVANAMVITPSPAITSYAAGQHFFVKAAASNSGATTINVNGLGVKSIVKDAIFALTDFDILEDQVILIIYDGTNFQIISGAGGSGGSGVSVPSGASVYNTGNVTASPITWDSEYFDTDSYHDNAVNTSRLTVPNTSRYLVTATTAMTMSAGTEAIQLVLRLNGTTVIAQSGSQLESGAGNQGGLSISGIFSLAAGDYVELLQTSSAGTLTTLATGSVFSIAKIGVSTKFGGTGVNGALSISSGLTTIDLAGAAIFEKNYTSISITGTGALKFINPHVNGTVVIIKSQGNVTLTSSATPMLDCSGLGGEGGAGGVRILSGGDTDGGGGNNGVTPTLIGIAGAGGLPSTGGTKPTAYEFSVNYIASQIYKQRYPNMAVGSGAGGGRAIKNFGSTDTATGGDGGNGGGCLIIECCGAWNFTTANGISVAGIDGTDGSSIGTSDDVSGGGGGGGAGGSCLVLYNTLVANTGTINVSGGIGGLTFENYVSSPEGGGGGASGINDGNNGVSAADGVQSGGNGADGDSIVLFNSEYA